MSADAVFDQLPADATHVKLIEGGPERHLALAELVGKLDVHASWRRTLVIRIERLRKTYGPLVAVDDLDLEIAPGTSSASSAATAPARPRPSA